MPEKPCNLRLRISINLFLYYFLNHVSWLLRVNPSQPIVKHQIPESLALRFILVSMEHNEQ